MHNILKADFYKLKKSKAFWICMILCLAFGLLMVIAMQQGMSRAQNEPELGAMFGEAVEVGGAWVMGNNISMGFHLVFIGVFVAIFVSSEFMFGTMKNTLSRGASRVKVFFSKFIVCGTAALTMFVTFLLTTLISGTIVWGFDPGGIVTASGLLGMILPQMLLVIAITALFVFVSMTMRSNGGAIAVNVMSVTMVSTLLSAVSMLFGSSVDLSQYWLTESVSKLATITPVSEDIVQGIAIAAVWGIMSIIVGSMLFKKKDVK